MLRRCRSKIVVSPGSLESFNQLFLFVKKTGVLARTKSKTAPDQIPFREVAFQPVFSLLLVDISAWHTYRIILIVIYYVLHWFLVCIFARIFVPKSFWPWITFCCDLGSWNSISWPSTVSKDLSGIKISMQAVIVQGMNDASPRFLSTWFGFWTVEMVNTWSDFYKEKVQMDVDEAICPTVDLQSTILSEWSLCAWWSTTSGLGSLAWKSSQIALFQWNIIILPEVDDIFVWGRILPLSNIQNTFLQGVFKRLCKYTYPKTPYLSLWLLQLPLPTILLPCPPLEQQKYELP